MLAEDCVSASSDSWCTDKLAGLAANKLKHGILSSRACVARQGESLLDYLYASLEDCTWKNLAPVLSKFGLSEEDVSVDAWIKFHELQLLWHLSGILLFHIEVACASIAEQLD